MKKIEPWTDDEIKLLKEKYPVSCSNEVRQMFPNRTYKAVCTKAKTLRLRKAFDTRKISRVWNAEKKALFIKLYPDTRNSELAKILGVSLSSIKNAAHTFGVRKSESYLKNPVTNRHFQKGHIPHNKGQKGIIYNGSEKGWFKKGNIPQNHKPIGSRRKDTKDGYWSEKVAEPSVWKLVHKKVWEEHNGPIPKGFIVSLIDNNPDNCDDINNLELITREESVKRCRESFGFAANCIERDPVKRKHIMNNAPELVELKQKQLLLQNNLK